MTDIRPHTIAQLMREPTRSPLARLPQYDRNRLVPAVVHLGAGSFHRAHQAVYFDDLAALGTTCWGVVGVGISRPELGEVLAAQDNLYVVVQRDRRSSSARVIGSLVDYLMLADDPAAVVERLTDPRTRLVTMTITGDGYDVTGPAYGGPTGVFDVLVAALDARRRDGIPPFTVLSCDNLPDNAAAARNATVAVARRSSVELATWITDNVCFPASMVDRITPHTSPSERDDVQAEFAVDDRWPVLTEPFAQWIIEDCFSDGRPPLDLVGARFVRDVQPYKLIKNRLLNGSHCALGYLGLLAGHATTAEAMRDPQLARFISHLMRTEIAPALPATVPGMELEPYQRVLLERFSSPAIADPLQRLAGRGSTKVTDYVVPSLRDAIAAGRDRRALTLAVAAWARCLSGGDGHGRTIDIADARLDELRAVARAVPDDSADFLALDVFDSLDDKVAFGADLTRCARLLADRGVHAAIDDLLGPV
jgi:mannitol 2-dehydrogenase